MTDHIEVWRNEFESLFDDNLLRRDDSGAYLNNHRQCLWIGYLMAKRRQPVMVLPEMQSCEGIYFVEDDYYHAKEIHAALNKAGIAYTVGK